MARLATVLTQGEVAGDHIGRINTLYGTNMCLRTDLVDGYRIAGTAVALNQVAAASLGGAPAAEFVNLPATSGDAMLAPDSDLD